MPRTPHTVEKAIAALKVLGKPENRAGMARFGIAIENALGVSMPDIRKTGSQITKDHPLAQALWDSELHEARILASLVDKPVWVTESQMDEWVVDFNSWDLCDQVCGNLFDRTPYTHAKIRQWAVREEEFVKRAAFATIAWCAVHDKKREDAEYLDYLPIIEMASNDPRNFVKKAVNWALRQIGKRSAFLHPHALELAQEMENSSDKTRVWIGKDAAKELDSEKIRARLNLP